MADATFPPTSPASLRTLIRQLGTDTLDVHRVVFVEPGLLPATINAEAEALCRDRDAARSALHDLLPGDHPPAEHLFNQRLERLSILLISQAVQKQSEEQSVFAQLFKNVHLLYGDQFAFNQCGAIEPQPFQKVSVEMEVPRLEFIDPEYMLLRRLQAKMQAARIQQSLATHAEPPQKAMRQAQRSAAQENARYGLPLIVDSMRRSLHPHGV